MKNSCSENRGKIMFKFKEGDLVKVVRPRTNYGHPERFMKIGFLLRILSFTNEYTLFNDNYREQVNKYRVKRFGRYQWYIEDELELVKRV
jgi:hypothetical protein